MGRILGFLGLLSLAFAQYTIDILPEQAIESTSLEATYAPYSENPQAEAPEPPTPIEPQETIENAPAPISTSTKIVWTKDEAVEIILDAAKEHGIGFRLAYELFDYESQGFNYLAKNPHSSASGLAQVISSTWDSYCLDLGTFLESRFNAYKRAESRMRLLNHSIGH